MTSHSKQSAGGAHSASSAQLVIALLLAGAVFICAADGRAPAAIFAAAAPVPERRRAGYQPPTQAVLLSGGNGGGVKKAPPLRAARRYQDNTNNYGDAEDEAGEVAVGDKKDSKKKPRKGRLMVAAAEENGQIIRISALSDLEGFSDATADVHVTIPMEPLLFNGGADDNTVKNVVGGSHFAWVARNSVFKSLTVFFGDSGGRLPNSSDTSAAGGTEGTDPAYYYSSSSSHAAGNNSFSSEGGNGVTSLASTHSSDHSYQHSGSGGYGHSNLHSGGYSHGSQHSGGGDHSHSSGHSGKGDESAMGVRSAFDTQSAATDAVIIQNASFFFQNVTGRILFTRRAPPSASDEDGTANPTPTNPYTLSVIGSHLTIFGSSGAEVSFAFGGADTFVDSSIVIEGSTFGSLLIAPPEAEEGNDDDGTAEGDVQSGASALFADTAFYIVGNELKVGAGGGGGSPNSPLFVSATLSGGSSFEFSNNSLPDAAAAQATVAAIVKSRSTIHFRNNSFAAGAALPIDFAMCTAGDLAADEPCMLWVEHCAFGVSGATIGGSDGIDTSGALVQLTGNSVLMSGGGNNNYEGTAPATIIVAPLRGTGVVSLLNNANIRLLLAFASGFIGAVEVWGNTASSQIESAIIEYRGDVPVAGAAVSVPTVLFGYNTIPFAVSFRYQSETETAAVAKMSIGCSFVTVPLLQQEGGGDTEATVALPHSAFPGGDADAARCPNAGAFLSLRRRLRPADANATTTVAPTGTQQPLTMLRCNGTAMGVPAFIARRERADRLAVEACFEAPLEGGIFDDDGESEVEGEKANTTTTSGNITADEVTNATNGTNATTIAAVVVPTTNATETATNATTLVTNATTTPSAYNTTSAPIVVPSTTTTITSTTNATTTAPATTTNTSTTAPNTTAVATVATTTARPTGVFPPDSTQAPGGGGHADRSDGEGGGVDKTALGIILAAVGVVVVFLIIAAVAVYFGYCRKVRKGSPYAEIGGGFGGGGVARADSEEVVPAPGGGRVQASSLNFNQHNSPSRRTFSAGGQEMHAV